VRVFWKPLTSDHRIAELRLQRCTISYHSPQKSLSDMRGSSFDEPLEASQISYCIQISYKAGREPVLGIQLPHTPKFSSKRCLPVATGAPSLQTTDPDLVVKTGGCQPLANNPHEKTFNVTGTFPWTQVTHHTIYQNQSQCNTSIHRIERNTLD
jgi:hypothetical protein